MNTIVDLTSPVLSIQCLECDMRGEKNPLLVVLPKKLVLINALSGLEVASFPMPSSERAEIIDCVYSKQLRIFVACLSNGSIISIPENAIDTTEYSLYKHSSKCQKLLSSDSKIFGVCENGGVVRFNLEKGLINGIRASQPPPKGYSYVTAVVLDRIIATLLSVHSKKKSDGKKYVVSICDSSSLGESNDCTCVDIEGVVDESTSPVPVHLVVNGASQSLSLVYHSSKSGIRWLKIDSSGEVLFERTFEMSSTELFPNAIIGFSSSLWVMSVRSGNCGAEVWQTRYGVRPVDADGRAVTLRLPGYQSDDAPTTSKSLSHIKTAAVALRAVTARAVAVVVSSCHLSADEVPTFSLSQHLFHSSEHSFLRDTLREMDAPVDSNHPSSDEVAGDAWTLASMVGALKRTRNDSEMEVAKKGKRSRKGSSQQGALSLLASDVQEELRGMMGEKIGADDQEKQEDAAMEFLRVAEQMCSLTVGGGSVDWVDEDWLVLNVLFSRGYVAMSMYPHLFGVVLSKKSPELLVTVAKLSIDLTEKQCMRLVLSAATVESEENTTKTSAKRSKKSKKGSSSEGDFSDGNLKVFVRVVEEIMNRKGGFDASVLAETLRSLNMAAAAVLLKTFAVLLRGTCSGNAALAITGEETSSSGLSDTAMQNVLTWVESLLESHFHSIAMGSATSFHGLQSAIASLVEEIKHLDAAVELTESAVGLCTHIHRMNKHNRGAHVLPLDGTAWSSEGANGVYQLSVVHF